MAVEEAALALPRLVACAGGGLEELEAGPPEEASPGEAEVCGFRVAVGLDDWMLKCVARLGKRSVPQATLGREQGCMSFC